MKTSEVVRDNPIEDNSRAFRPVPDLVRFTVGDAPWWLLYRAAGWSVVQQMVWDFPEEVNPESLRRFNDALCHGRLHRQLVEPRVRGARPYWVRAPRPVPLVLDEQRIADDAVADWALDELRGVRLDPDEGRCWRLRAAVTETGRTVVSLCTLHMVADGKARVAAVAEALAAVERGDRMIPPKVPHPVASRSSDVVDAARQLSAACAGILRAVKADIRTVEDERQPLDSRAPRSPLAERAPAATPVWTTATVPTADWDEVARSHGGTANSLYIAVVSGLLRAGGYTAPDNQIKVGIPVAARTDEDHDRGNAVAGVSIYLSPVPAPVMDLGVIREECRRAYKALAGGRRATEVHLVPLGWFLPPSLITKRGAPEASYPDAMASNIGDLPPEVCTVGGVRASAVTVRGVPQGVDSEGRLRYGEGIHAWMARTETNVTFTLCGFDEQHFVDDDTLRRLLAEELTAWGLPHRIW